MPEAVATLAPAGSGRFEDWIWPSRFNAAQGPFNNSLCSSRNSSTDLNGFFGGAGAPVNHATTYLGVPCIETIATAADTSQYLFYPPLPMYFPTSRNALNPPQNDRAVYRIVWIFAGSGLAPNAGLDMGLEFVKIIGTAGRILIDAGDGWGFRLNGTTLEWIVRGPNGLVTLNIATLAGGFDITQWHCLDLRIRGATAVADAGLELRLDNLPVNLGPLNSSWAAGTNLPPQTLLGANVGYRPAIFINPGNNNRMYHYQLRKIAAPTLLATL